jgi:para-aminobenzoate synthetase component 1
VLNTQKVEYGGNAVDAVAAIRDESFTCFLDNSLPGKLGRWSFIGYRPFLVMTMENGRVLINGRDAGSDPFAILSELLKEHKVSSDETAPPFASGAAGFLSYDFGRHFEKIQLHATDDLPQPDLCLAFYDCVLAFDHADNRTWLCHLPSANEKAKELLSRLRTASYPAVDKQSRLFKPGQDLNWTNIESNFSRNDYLKAIKRIKEYIAAGDIYQINLSQRFSRPFHGDSWELYQILRAINPAPFGCFIDFPDITLAGVSPERLLNLDGKTRMVETRPIKGTRPRGRCKREDRLLADELRRSEKDRAENLMIVDLERNDLGKVCDYGSIHVPSLWNIEEHPNVFQMVSTVKGKLRSDKTPADLLAACFPGGSITGAPKIRAMQIIEELEPNRRGIYTGSVGYVDFRGNLDVNIVIRSIVMRNNRAYFHGGGGIVIDSVPEKEYDETLYKVSGLVAALATASSSENR